MAKPAKKKTGARKARTPAQIAATKRMIAANKKASKPAAKRPAAPKAPAKKSYSRPAAKAVKVVYKRNPVPAAAKGVIHGQLIPAATGAAGYLAFETAWGLLPVEKISPKLRVGAARHAARLGTAGAIALGVDKLAKGKMRRHLVNASVGNLTVLIAEVGEAAIQKQFPQFGLGEADELAGLEAMIEDLQGMEGVIDGDYQTVGDVFDQNGMGDMGDVFDQNGMGEIGFYQHERYDSAAV